MTGFRDIPVIARGRIIMPSEGDAVEFKGRGGSSFRSPDPHRHIQDLVLGNPAHLADLNGTRMADIIAFLAEGGRRLRLDDNPYLQESFALALQAGGLAEPILRGVYDALPDMFEPGALTALVDRTIGIRYLDGWVPGEAPHDNVRVRAVGTRQLHITAGNVPVVAALTIVRGALLFEVADQLQVSLLGLSAKYIDSVMKAEAARAVERPADRWSFSALRTICSTGSPLSPEGFAWIYQAVAADVHLASISGGTDLCGCLVMGDPTGPVYAGEIQTKALGVAVEVLDENGRPVGPDVKGELACTRPFPSMPLRFWGDDGTRYRQAYFERFDGVWAHGDYASWTDRGGMIIHGRSDATLNASGIRIGTAEIYRVVEQLDEVIESIAIGQEWEGDTRIVLFVRLADGVSLDDDLVSRIRSELRTKCSPRHVPAVVAQVADIPRTRSGKIVELAVTETVHGRPIKNWEALANPEALAYYANRPELA